MKRGIGGKGGDFFLGGGGLFTHGDTAPLLSHFVRQRLKVWFTRSVFDGRWRYYDICRNLGVHSRVAIDGESN